MRRTIPLCAPSWHRWPTECSLISGPAAWPNTPVQRAPCGKRLLLSNFLGKYLPRNVRAEHSGEVVAVNGKVSQQCDLLIVDPSTPAFWDEENYRIVPAECVYGVIEVKSFLDSEQLKKAGDLIAGVKALPKTAYFPSQPARTRTMYGQAWPYVPTVGMVFAYDGISIESLCDTFEELADKNQHQQCIDSVWVLNRGFINWWDGATGMAQPGRDPGCTYRAFNATPQQMLMPFTAHLHQHFGTAWMPPFKIVDYLANVPWGEAVCEGVPG